MLPSRGMRHARLSGMRPLRILIGASIALIFNGCAGLSIPAGGSTSGGSTGSRTSTSTSTTSSGNVAADIVAYTNDARARNGLRPLATSAKLLEAARLHALQMAQYQRAE